MKIKVLFFTICLFYFSCERRNYNYCNQYKCLSEIDFQADTTLFNYFDIVEDKKLSPQIIDYLISRGGEWYLGAGDKRMDTIEQISNVFAFYQHKNPIPYPMPDKITAENMKELDLQQEKAAFIQIDKFITEIMQVDSTQILLLYEAAKVYMGYEKYEKAYSFYQKIDHLFPKGYKDTKVWIHVLEKYQKGIITKSETAIYCRYRFGKHLYEIRLPYKVWAMSADTTEKIAAVWADRCQFLENDGLLQFCIKKGFENAPDAETFGQLQLYQYTSFLRKKDTAQCLQLLGDLLLCPKTTHKNRLKARYALQNIILHKPFDSLGRPPLNIGDIRE